MRYITRIEDLGQVEIEQTTHGVSVSTVSEYDYILKNVDIKVYTEYFNSIRDYIIDNIDKFSTQSLIHAMELYYGCGNDIEYDYIVYNFHGTIWDDRYGHLTEEERQDYVKNAYKHWKRIKPAVDLYNYCKVHPNNVEPNDKDFILGVLFVCGFDYITDSSETDEIYKVDEFLEENKGIGEAIYGSGGCYAAITVRNIENVLKLLIPEFNVPQPVYHFPLDDNNTNDIIMNIEHVPIDDEK